MSEPVQLSQLLTLDTNTINGILEQNELGFYSRSDIPDSTKLRKLIMLYKYNLSRSDQIVVSSKYFTKYIKMNDVSLLKTVKNIGRIPKDRTSNITTLVLNDEMNDIIKIVKSKGKTNYERIFNMILLKPDKIAKAYRYLNKYSLLNITVVLAQMINRRIEISPIKTFNEWKNLGIAISKGEKGIGMYVPIPMGHEQKQEQEQKTKKTFTRFRFAKKWFAQSQTSVKNDPPIIDTTGMNIDMLINKIRKIENNVYGTYEQIITLYLRNHLSEEMSRLSAFIILNILGTNQNVSSIYDIRKNIKHYQDLEDMYKIIEKTLKL